MSSPGFWHFAHQAPTKLALAAPDGRHWSRGELRDECDRIVRNLQQQGLQAGDCVETALPNCAELLALKLAVEQLDCVLLMQTPGSETTNTAPGISAVRAVFAQSATDRHAQKMAEVAQLMTLFDIPTEAHNVHFCGCPLHDPEAMMWALNSLHYGHPVVLAEQWDARSMLHAIDQYRVTTSYMVPSQFSRLLELPQVLRDRYDVSSIHRMIYSGAPCPPEVKRQMIAWWGMSIYECSGRNSSQERNVDTDTLIHY